MKFLKFDIKNTITQRLQSDKFALAYDIRNKCIENCQLCYMYVTKLAVSEMWFRYTGTASYC